MVPAILVNELGRLGGALVVTLAADGATEAELTTREGGVLGGVLHLRHVNELHLNAQNRETHVANGSQIPVLLGRDGGTRLSLAVALEDGNSEANSEEGVDRLREGGRSRDHEADPTTKLFLDLGEDEGVPDGVSHVALLETLSLGGKGSLKEGLLDATTSHNSGHDLVIKTVPEAGNGDEEGGLEDEDVVKELADITTVETSRGTEVHHGVHDEALKGVGQREVGDVDVLMRK